MGIKKIMLLQPNYFRFGKRVWEMLPYSLGLLNACINKDFETQLLDPNLGNLNDEEIKERLRIFSPEVVGVSTISTEYLEETTHITKLIKEALPNCIVIEGGVLPTVCLETAMKDKNVDYWFLREGEFRFLEFLRELDKEDPNLSKIGGIAYYLKGEPVTQEFGKTEGLVFNLDSIPFPDYGNLDMLEYGNKTLKYTAQLVPEKYPFAIASTSRGCPFQCTFCSGWTVTGRRVRMRSAENVLKEVDELYGKGIREIIYLDDHFLFDRERAITIMKGLIERNYDLKWKCVNVNISNLDEEILKLMKESGSYQITVSVESGNEKVLKEMIKKPFIDLKKSVEILQIAHDMGFELISNFVFGYPQETWEQIRETFAYAANLAVDYVVFHIATPLPKTELMNMYIERGLIKEGEEISGFCLPLISTKEFTADQLKMLRTLEWDRINFSSLERKKRIAKIQGISLEELEKWRKDTLNKLGVGVVK